MTPGPWFDSLPHLQSHPVELWMLGYFLRCYSCCVNLVPRHGNVPYLQGDPARVGPPMFVQWTAPSAVDIKHVRSYAQERAIRGNHFHPNCLSLNVWSVCRLRLWWCSGLHGTCRAMLFGVLHQQELPNLQNETDKNIRKPRHTSTVHHGLISGSSQSDRGIRDTPHNFGSVFLLAGVTPASLLNDVKVPH